VDGRELREADLARIDTIPNNKNIAIVAPELLGAVDVGGRQALLMGVRLKEEFALKKWWRLSGRPPRGDQELVAGAAAARTLGLSAGDVVTVGDRRLTVAGVLAPTGSQDDDLLIADLAVAQGILARPGAVSMVQVAALCSDCPVEEMAVQLSDALPDTRVTALQEKVRNRMDAIDQFRTFSWIVAGVVIVIEALVVLVTMMGSVNARTREIGIFRTLGFRRGHVTRLILMEAVAASVLAGALGYLAGMGVSYALLPLLAGDGVWITWAPGLAGAAVGLAAAIGAAGSLYPAFHASRLDPTVALRAL
jgi:putative ABC transport system permease protein